MRTERRSERGAVLSCILSNYLRKSYHGVDADAHSVNEAISADLVKLALLNRNYPLVQTRSVRRLKNVKDASFSLMRRPKSRAFARNLSKKRSKCLEDACLHQVHPRGISDEQLAARAFRAGGQVFGQHLQTDKGRLRKRAYQEARRYCAEAYEIRSRVGVI